MRAAINKIKKNKNNFFFFYQSSKLYSETDKRRSFERVEDLNREKLPRRLQTWISVSRQKKITVIIVWSLDSHLQLNYQ